MNKRPLYNVTTWDVELQRFTPQAGVRKGPYTLFGLRRVLRKLQGIGYDVAPRDSAVSVLVERRD